MFDDNPTLFPGMVLADRYELTAEIGRGGFGMVWKARQLNMDRAVAIKVLPPKFIANPDVVERFKREARLASRLSHPNTITVHDYGQHADLLFIVMELLSGKDLADVLASRPKLPIDRIVRIAKQVLQSLDEAHSHGIVHRDLKPENIFLTDLGSQSDHVKVLDFGIAKLAMPELGAEQDREQRKLTMSGSTVGTPTYMSPEQAAGEPIGLQTDLYALGVILWEMAAGRPPFDDDNPVKLMRSHLFEPIPTFPDDTLRGSRFVQVVERALTKDVEKRYSSAMEFYSALNVELSTLLDSEFDDPRTVEFVAGLSELERDANALAYDAYIAHERTDSFEVQAQRHTPPTRKSTDTLLQGVPAAPSPKSSSPSSPQPKRESAPSTQPSKDTQTRQRKKLRYSTSPPVITVVDPGPDDDIILLTQPKAHQKPDASLSEPDDSRLSSGFHAIHTPDAGTPTFSNARRERRTSSQTTARARRESLRETVEDEAEFAPPPSDLRSIALVIVAALGFVATAAVAYLFYAGILP